MFIQHVTREILVRAVVTGPPASGAMLTVGTLYARFNGEHLLERVIDDFHVLQFDFIPKDLGTIRGYTVRPIVHGLDTRGPGYDPANLSGFSDVDGVILVGQGHRVPETIATGQRIAAGLTAAGYDWSKVPLVVQIERAGHPDLGAEIRQMLKLGERPIVETALMDGTGVVDGFKQLMRQMLLAMKDGHLRVTESQVGPQ